MISLIGDGGHAKVVRDVIYESGPRAQFMDYTFVAVGDNRSRKREAEKAPNPPPPPIIHPFAYVAKSAIIGNGTIVMAGAVIQPYAVIGRHVIINTGATVDHDCVIGDYAHIAPGAHLCGGVEIGEGTLVGVGVGIAPLAKIHPWSLVKARRLEIEPLPSH